MQSLQALGRRCSPAHSLAPGSFRQSSAQLGRFLSRATTLQAPLTEPQAQYQQQEPAYDPLPLEPQQPVPGSPPRVFPDKTLYRQNDAVTLKILPPTWEQKQDGAWTVTRVGVFMLEFAKALPGQSGRPQQGQAKFDWTNKQNIALSPEEFFSVTEHSRDPAASAPVDIIHDPGMRSGRQGQEIKKLQASKQTNGGLALYLSIGSKNFNSGMILSSAEVAVFRAICNFATPRLYGFDKQLI